MIATSHGGNQALTKSSVAAGISRILVHGSLPTSDPATAGCAPLVVFLALAWKDTHVVGATGLNVYACFCVDTYFIVI